MDGPRTYIRIYPAVDIIKATQQREGAKPVRCRCRLGCIRWGSHWRHLANITELSVCGGEAALWGSEDTETVMAVESDKVEQTDTSLNVV